MSEDKAFISNPDKWPYWPALPVKRYDKTKPGSFPECGLILADTLTRVYHNVSVFGLDEKPGKTWSEKLKDVPTTDYLNLDALLADGWVVD